MKRSSLFIILFLIGTMLFAQEKTKKSRKEIRKERAAQRIAEVDSILSSGTFYFDINSAHSSLFNTVHLTDLYFIKLTPDSVFTNLPYYGRAYRINYSDEDGGINLSHPHTALETEMRKKNKQYSFSVKTNFDKYDFYVSVSSTGYASISVSSMNRQTIRFNGELTALPDKI